MRGRLLTPKLQVNILNTFTLHTQPCACEKRYPCLVQGPFWGFLMPAHVQHPVLGPPSPGPTVLPRPQTEFHSQGDRVWHHPCHLLSHTRMPPMWARLQGWPLAPSHLQPLLQVISDVSHVGLISLTVFTHQLSSLGTQTCDSVR